MGTSRARRLQDHRASMKTTPRAKKYALVCVFVIILDTALGWSRLVLAVSAVTGWAVHRIATTFGLLMPGTRGKTYLGETFGVGMPWIEEVGQLLGTTFTTSLAVFLGLLLYHRVTFKHRRDSVTRCGNCSYDLHGIAIPRCPECGKTI